VLRDRRRSQRGSVLSGVLIITLFLAILSAALMTELSTNLLITQDLVNRVANEATVNSAIELTIDQLQNTRVGLPCPSASTATDNGMTAAASYVSCETSVDSASPGFTAVAGNSPFTTDGTHVVLSSFGWNVNEYLVGDAGSLYELDFGSAAPNWAYSIGGPLTGPPNAIRDSLSGPPNVIDLVPTATGCGGSPDCVLALTESAGSMPSASCAMGAEGPVTSRPVGGVRNSSVVFFGDANGDLYAYSPGTSGDTDCNLDSSLVIEDGMPMVAGPFVFAGPFGTDEVYAVASDGSSSEIVHYAYSFGSGFTSASFRDLPYGAVAGASLDGNTLPARLAITYAGGQVTMAQISNTYGISILAGGATLGTAIDAAPYWCQCPSGTLIGVGGENGTLYLLDTSFNQQATYGGTASITTSPTADAAGDWFFGASDAYLYEVAEVPGQTAMVREGIFGPLDGAVGSSAMSGLCPNGVCVYTATGNRHAYLTTFDARNVVMTACVSTAPPACSGADPRVWAKVQIGAIGAARSVRTTGWSYYSP